MLLSKEEKVSGCVAPIPVLGHNLYLMQLHQAVFVEAFSLLGFG